MEVENENWQNSSKYIFTGPGNAKTRLIYAAMAHEAHNIRLSSDHSLNESANMEPLSK